MIDLVRRMRDEACLAAGPEHRLMKHGYGVARRQDEGFVRQGRQLEAWSRDEVVRWCPLKLVSDTVDVGGEAQMSLTITNTGKRRGTDVVPLYAADTATGVTLPAQQLIGFTRVDLEPGASTTVSFVIPLSVLAYTGLSGEFLMEPGPIELSAGGSSDALRSKANLTVTGKTRVIKGEDRKFLSVATVGSSDTSSNRQ